MKLSELVLQVRRAYPDSEFGFVGFDGAGRAIFFSSKRQATFIPDVVVAKVELLEPEQPSG